MAKRKRLTPANPTPHLDRTGPAPETKSMYPLGVAPTRSFTSAPIADVAQQSAAAAALEEMSDTLRAARESGRMVLDLPLDDVDEAHLVRDRTRVDDEEMAALRASIAARGQQTPIEVVALGSGRYGLISGWRRLTALRQLAAESETGGFDTVQALLRRPDDSADAYLSMIEENEIRVGLSYYERARIAARSVEQGVFETHKAALLCLFNAASRTKRSKIRSFLRIVEALDDLLRFPEEIGERLGLQLAAALEADKAARARFRKGLTEAAAETAAREQEALKALLKPARRKAAEAPARSEAGLPSRSGAREVPRPGLSVERAGPSRVILEGPALDNRLYQRLLTFLATEN